MSMKDIWVDKVNKAFEDKDAELQITDSMSETEKAQILKRRERMEKLKAFFSKKVNEDSNPTEETSCEA